MDLLHLFRSAAAVVVRDSMLFYDVNVLVIRVFVDPPNAIQPDVAVKLLVVDEVGHLVEETVDCDTEIGHLINYFSRSF